MASANKLDQLFDSLETKDELLEELKRIKRMKYKWLRPLPITREGFLKKGTKNVAENFVKKAMKAFGIKEKYALKFISLSPSFNFRRDLDWLVSSCKHQGLVLAPPEKEPNHSLFVHTYKTATKMVFSGSKKDILGNNFEQVQDTAEIDLQGHISYIFYYGNNKKNPFTHLISL